LRRHPDRLAALVLLLTAALVVGPPLLAGQTISPAALLGEVAPWRGRVPLEPAPNPALTDIAQVFHPWLLWAGAQLRAGGLPLWNPHAYAGAPFFGNGQSALLFPLTLVAVILPGAIAVTVMAGMKLSGIGLATYWFLRTLAIAPLPALIGSWTFMLSATVIGWLPWTFASTFMFLPALLAATERLRATPDRRALVLLAVIVALDVCAGYPQGTVHGFAVATAWAVCRARGGPRAFLGWWAGGMVLGLGLAAVQLVPFLEYVRESLVLAYRAQWTLPLYTPWRSAVTFLMPYYYGTGAQSWGPWQFNIITGWVGIVPLAVLPLAVVAAWRRPGGRIVLGLAIVTLALHYHAPGLGALSEVPGLSLGTNLRLMPLLAFALAVLTSLGIEALATSDRPSRWLAHGVLGWFVLVGALALLGVTIDHVTPAARGLRVSLPVQYALSLVALTLAAVVVARALAGALAAERAAMALAALQLITLLPLAVDYQPRVERGAFYPSTPALDHLRRATSDGARVLMPGYLGLLYGLFEAQGYDGVTPRRLAEIAGPVGTGRVAQWGLLENTLALNGSEPLSGDRVLVSPVLDLLGVRYVLQSPGAPPPRAGLVVDYDAADARIYRNDAALPRAFVVVRARCVNDHEARRLIAASAVDFRREVLLADCDGSPAVAEAPAASASASIVAYTGPAVTIRAATDQPSFLVVTDTWFPGWTVRVDGMPTRLWRANHAFRAVALPPGEHQVQMHYEPASLRIGLALSGASLLVGMTSLAWRRQ
jgi:membrane protein YfhO